MLVENLRDRLPDLFGDIRNSRLRIRVHTNTHYGNREFKSYLRSPYIVLADLTKLDSMHIILEDPAKELPRWPKVIHESEDGLEANGHFKLLAPEDFTLLRKIRTATFEGLPLAYTTYLESTIIGNSPLDHVPKMCEPLERPMRNIIAESASVSTGILKGHVSQ